MNKRILKKREIGIDKKEVYDLHRSFVKFMLPRLKMFLRINTHSYSDDFKSLEEWHEAVKKMIWSFQYIDDQLNEKYDPSYFKEKENIEQYEEGMKIFSKYCFDLWD